MTCAFSVSTTLMVGLQKGIKSERNCSPAYLQKCCCGMFNWGQPRQRSLQNLSKCCD